MYKKIDETLQTGMNIKARFALFLNINVSLIFPLIFPLILFINLFIYSLPLNKNTVGAIQKHCGSDLKTLRERESAPSVF